MKAPIHRSPVALLLLAGAWALLTYLSRVFA